HLDLRQNVAQRSEAGVDPVVHSITGDQPKTPELPQHLELHLGIDVAEKDILRVAVRFRQLGDEAGEHVEVQLDRVAHVEIFVIAAAPVKRVAARALEPLKVDAAAAEKLQILFGKIPADDAHDSHGGEEARAHAEISRRA